MHLTPDILNIGNLPRYFSFQPYSHSLGQIFVSPQAFSVFESKKALARSKCARSRLRSPKYASIAGYNLAKHLFVILLL